MVVLNGSVGDHTDDNDFEQTEPESHQALQR